MATQLTFSESYFYSDSTPGITLPIVLRNGAISYSTFAKVDTGSDVCLFSREIAEDLGLRVEEGIPLRLDTLGGSLESFGHEIILQSYDIAFYSTVYFAKAPGLRRNLLGRQGWLRQLRVAIVDYDNQIYLRRYDD